MKTIIIYDNDGMIVYQASGGIKKPNGLPYLEIDIPIDKRVVSVDVINKVAVYEDIPKSEGIILADKISILEQENADLLLDSALKDARIQTTENDIADLTLEVAIMGGK